MVVVGGHEHLALAGQAAERPAVLDAVEVALEAGAEAVGLLVDGPVAGARRPGGRRREGGVLLGLPRPPLDEGDLADGHGPVRHRLVHASEGTQGV